MSTVSNFSPYASRTPISTARLHRAQTQCERAERPDYADSLKGFLGADPAVLMEK